MCSSCLSRFRSSPNAHKQQYRNFLFLIHSIDAYSSSGNFFEFSSSLSPLLSVCLKNNNFPRISVERPFWTPPVGPFLRDRSSESDPRIASKHRTCGARYIPHCMYLPMLRALFFYMKEEGALVPIGRYIDVKQNTTKSVQ